MSIWGCLAFLNLSSWPYEWLWMPSLVNFLIAMVTLTTFANVYAIGNALQGLSCLSRRNESSDKYNDEPLVLDHVTTVKAVTWAMCKVCPVEQEACHCISLRICSSC